MNIEDANKLFEILKLKKMDNNQISEIAACEFLSFGCEKPKEFFIQVYGYFKPCELIQICEIANKIDISAN